MGRLGAGRHRLWEKASERRHSEPFAVILSIDDSLAAAHDGQKLGPKKVRATLFLFR
jgi:hypothetical protein